VPGSLVYAIPLLKMSMVKWVREYTQPASEIQRVPTKPAPKRRKGPRGRIAKRDPHFGDYRREVYLDLSYGVADMAALGPEQWDLIHGAELVVHRRRSLARLENDLPTRAITVDLWYPMDRIARVTVRPYKIGTHRKMTVGYLLWQLSQAYGRIYDEWARWGVRNHSITDLRFISIELDDNIGTVGVCS